MDAEGSESEQKAVDEKTRHDIIMYYQEGLLVYEINLLY